MIRILKINGCWFCSRLFREVCIYIYPNKEKTKEQIFDLRKNAPMMYLFSTTIQDAKGRTIARIGSLENDLDDHIVKATSQNFSFSSPEAIKNLK